MIPYSTQCIDEDDIEAVSAVMRSAFLTSGPKVPEFEERLCEETCAPYCAAVSSATAGLHLSMLALGIGPGDTVLVSNVSFVSSANCAAMVGARVRFIDTDPITGLITPETLKSALEREASAGCKVKAVVAVHLSGRPLDLAGIYQLKKRWGFYLIEDAAHALGAEYRNSPIGDCTFAEATVFSFHPVKIITTAEGGAVCCADEGLHQKICELRSHGIVHDREHLKDHSHPNFYYEMQSLGFNYRLSDLQAALGLSQLEKLAGFLEKRRALAAYYQEIFTLDIQNEYGITLPPPDERAAHERLSSWHLFQIGAPLRDELYQRLREKGIGVQIHYLPISRHPYYGAYGLPGSDDFFARTLSIPLHVKLNKRDLSMIAAFVLEQLDKLQKDHHV